MDPGTVVAGFAITLTLGKILQKVIDKLHVIDTVQGFRKRDKTLADLTDRVKRLQPSVNFLTSLVRDEGEHPASGWLGKLEELLTKLHDGLQCSGRVVKWLRTRNELQSLDEEISKLLAEGPVVLEAERHWRIAQDVISEPAHSRQKRLCNTYSEFRSIRDGVLVNDWASSSTHAGSREVFQLGNRADDSSAPEISFASDKVAEELMAKLLNVRRSDKWFGLWAMGGAGKTFTARKVFNDSRINAHFTGGKFWLTVSKLPRQHAERDALFLLRELCERIGGGENVHTFPDVLEGAKARVNGLLKNKQKVLLILDDVWDRNTLEHLDVVAEGVAGAIVVSTRDERIFTSDEDSRSVAESADIVQVPPLSDEDSWKLFCWHAFGHRGLAVKEELRDIVKQMVQECKGLPLALTVIGATVGDITLSNNEKREGKSLQSKWREQLAKLERANLEGDRYEALYGRLQLSVDSLREEDLPLQDCFFYFAAFPEDHEIPVEDLVVMWIAEGMVENSRMVENRLLSREVKARSFLGQLIAKSMVEFTPLGHECKIHDVMRDLASRNLRGVVGIKHGVEVCKWECLYEPSGQSKQVPEEWTSSNTPLAAKRLSLIHNDLRRLPGDFRAPRLEVIMLAENEHLSVLLPGFFGPLSRLKVLDLSGTKIQKVPGGVLQSLKALVLLNLSGCEELRKISSRLRHLHNLETIFLDECATLRFPTSLKSLPKLTTVGMPLSTKTFATALSRLRTLGGGTLVQSLKFQKNFQHLRIHRAPLFGDVYAKPSGICLDLSSLNALEKLDLFQLDPLPRGILQLHRLRVLKIVHCEGTLPALDELQGLEECLLWGSFSLERTWTLPESFGREGGFPSLKRLTLMDVPFDSVTLHPGTMPKIERLALEGLRKPVRLATSLRELQNLRSLLIVGLHAFPESDFDNVFSGESYFPNLGHLELCFAGRFKRTPFQLKFLPALRYLGISASKEDWPFLELEETGKVKVEVSPAPSFASLATPLPRNYYEALNI